MPTTPPADLIAIAFYELGYRPRESVVLLGVGDGGRVPVVMRLDLADAGRPSAMRDVARALRGAGAGRVVAVWASEEDPAAVRRRSRRLETSLSARGLPVAQAWHVLATGYREVGCRIPVCCPPEGRPLTEVWSSRAAAQAVAAGRALLAQEADLVADLPAPDDAPLPPASAPSGACDRAEWLRRWEGSLAATTALSGPPEGMAVALADPLLRDAVLLTLVPGRAARKAARALVRGEAIDLDAALDAYPDRDLLARGAALLAAAAREVAEPERVEVLALLGWAAWWSGDAARARLLSERALEAAPEHRLGSLVRSLLLAHVPPSWVPASCPPSETGYSGRSA